MKRVRKRDTWLKYLVAGSVIAAAIFWAHGARIASNFSQTHWEDTLFIQHEQEHIHAFPDCLRKPLWPGLYRPLTTNCYFYLVGQLTDYRLELHHLINLLVYAANGLLLLVLCQRFFPWPWALVPAALFVSRYAHAEVVTNSVEFQALLSVFFSLLALEFFIQGRSEGCMSLQVLACVALAVLSKETAVVIPAILVLYGWLFDRRSAWRSYLAPVIVVLIWTVLFVTVFRALTDYAPTGFTYEASLRSVLINYSAYLLGFANLLAYTQGDQITPERIVQLAATPFTLACFTVIGLGVGTVLLFHHRLRINNTERLRTLLFGLGFFVIGAAPFVILQDRLFMRYGYFAHAGLAIAWGVILQHGVELAWEKFRIGRLAKTVELQPF